jgi:hypothetical protein
MAWDIEHIIPLESSPNFMFEPLNLCVSCKDCNLSKSNKPVLVSKRVHLPLESKQYKIFHPHLDRYEDHIEILVVGELYKPITKKGENTIEICKLFRFYHKVNKTIPNTRINDLAKALLATPNGFARETLEDALIKEINSSRKLLTA